MMASESRRSQSRKRAATANELPGVEVEELDEKNNDDLAILRLNLNWSVQWSGTFPIGKVSQENVAKRLDALLSVNAGLGGGGSRLAGTRVVLSVSADGVSARAADNEKVLFLSHPLRKVCCVVGRVDSCQVAYITREPPSHSGKDVPYRKQCHVFRTQTPLEVEQIESVLSNAFQRALGRLGALDTIVAAAALSPKFRAVTTTTTTSSSCTPRPCSVSSSSLLQAEFPSPKKTPKKDVKLNRQMRLISSSSSLIQRLFGTTPSGVTAPKKQLGTSAKNGPVSLSNTPSSTGFRFRKPRWPLTPFRSSGLSATPKRVPPPLPLPRQFSTTTTPTRSIGTAFETSRTLSFDLATARTARSQELTYDGRLKEWLYPMDEMLNELERLAYFCRPGDREIAMEHLRRMPVGHFVLRLSGSRRHCLALSVRVEKDEQYPKGVAHFLVLQNEHGFRIRGSKRYFQSLPMLITHHSVLADQLPCRLQLSDWRWTREPHTLRRRQSSGGSTLAALRSREQTAAAGAGHQQWPETARVRWRRRPLLTGISAATRLNSQTNSTLFSSKSSTVLSA